MCRVFSTSSLQLGGTGRNLLWAVTAGILVSSIALPGCTQTHAGKSIPEFPIMTSKPSLPLTEVAGTFVSRGNAVDCPQIRQNDGRLQPVIGLSNSIVPGDRVRVSGRYGISTRCLGEVLIVEVEEKLPR